MTTGSSQLASKRVLLVGAGGLGSVTGTLLARAGVGRIDVLDDDIVDMSNLQRQTLYETEHVGRSKVACAVERLAQEASQAGHSGTRIHAHELRLHPGNALALVSCVDLVVEGGDNYPTKFLTADACALARIPCVQAGAVRWVGWVLGSVRSHESSSACVRCAFEDIPEGPDRGCSEAGVIGPVVGVIGALQAATALQLLMGREHAAGVLHHYRAMPSLLRQRRIERNPRCGACNGEITHLDRARYAARDCAA